MKKDNNPSSGGNLFDAEADLIGIITQKLVAETAERVGFAIPAELVLDLQKFPPTQAKHKRQFILILLVCLSMCIIISNE